MSPNILGQWPQWRDKLVLELRSRDVPGAAIGEILAEVEAHLQESGESPEVAFGDARTYAGQRAADEGGGSDGGVPLMASRSLPVWITWGLDDWPLRDMVLLATCSLGGLLAGFGARELSSGGDARAALSPWVALIMGILVCVAPPVVLPYDEIVDPRSGKGVFTSRFDGRGPVAALWVALLVLTFSLGWYSQG